ncbi:hypothetical protein IWZ03DRAFT_247178 [Phyllosticta citriasiana]|uniref:NACHT domain-containing protein n=1 Tax=Phyllosticta citriasiana TaxID=595635 RepID=A0ABR1KID4_9PEZI
MDPISVLSLAANIIQVVDYGFKIAKGAKEQYQSIDGMILRDLRRVQSSLISELSSQTHLTADAKDLLRISGLCDEVAEELQSELQSFVIPATAKHRKVQSLKRSFLVIWKQSTISEIEGRLGKIQRELDTRLMSMAKSDTSYLRIRLDEEAATNRSLHADTSVQISSAKSQIIDAITARTIDYGRVADLFTQIVSEEKDADKARAILKRIWYTEYLSRYNNITEAHQTTFRWIFDNQEHGFPDWIENQSGIYWISGKPGSGKSTLMKFVAEHDQTTQLLESWAGDQKIIVVSHYFWISGSSIQRSREGFLRSVIFQILRQHPVLIPKIFPKQWAERDEREFGNTSPKMLEAALCRIVDRSDRPKICFFIDGLDEYDCGQDEIVGLLKILEKVPSVKLCVSSRPWDEFEHAFRNNPKCRVHELTEDDIREFTRDSIGQSPDLSALIGSHLDNMIEQIVRRSCGVFIWVFFVVRMLLRAPAEGATSQDLQKKIDSYPTELDALFDRIYKTIKSEYRRDTARTLRIALEHWLGFPTLATFLAMEKHEDAEYAFSQDFHPVSLSEINEWRDTLGKRISARCKDFVCIVQMADSAVEGAEVFKYHLEFLHRTVRDYLQNELMPNHLEKELGNDFDVDQVLMKSVLVEWKFSDPLLLLRSKVNEYFVGYRLLKVLCLAKQYEYRWGRPMTRLIDEIDLLFSGANADEQNKHWSCSVSHYFYHVGPIDMIDLASYYHLSYYVVEKLKNSSVRDKARWNLLWHALTQVVISSGKINHRMILDELLSHGADVNQIVPEDGRTIWETFLHELYCATTRTTWEKVDEVVGDVVVQLLRSGADPDIIIQPHRHYRFVLDPEYSVGAFKYDCDQIMPSDPKTIEDLVRCALPAEYDRILLVLEQKRKERAKSRSQETSNPGEAFDSTPQATNSLRSANPHQGPLAKIFSSWNPFNLWPNASTQRRMLEDKPEENEEASASQGNNPVVSHT